MDFDWPKVELFGYGDGFYSFSPPSLNDKQTPSFLHNMIHFEKLKGASTHPNGGYGFLFEKKKWCLDNLIVKKIPITPLDNLEDRDYIIKDKWLGGDQDTSWSGVMKEIWQMPNKCVMTMGAGEKIFFPWLIWIVF